MIDAAGIVFGDCGLRAPRDRRQRHLRAIDPQFGATARRADRKRNYLREIIVRRGAGRALGVRLPSVRIDQRAGGDVVADAEGARHGVARDGARTCAPIASGFGTSLPESAFTTSSSPTVAASPSPNASTCTASALPARKVPANTDDERIAVASMVNIAMAYSAFRKWVCSRAIAAPMVRGLPLAGSRPCRPCRKSRSPAAAPNPRSHRASAPHRGRDIPARSTTRFRVPGAPGPKGWPPATAISTPCGAPSRSSTRHSMFGSRTCAVNSRSANAGSNGKWNPLSASA